MSEQFQPVDDVTMELATVLDEMSAVDCYRMKKDLPLHRPCKKVLSYKDILQTGFHRTTSSDPASPNTIGTKLPDSIDMDYIDMLSGKNYYTSKEEETRIPISINSYERLCYWTPLIKEQNQEIKETARTEGARGKTEAVFKETADEQTTSASSADNDEVREKNLLNFEEESSKDNDATESGLSSLIGNKSTWPEKTTDDYEPLPEQSSEEVDESSETKTKTSILTRVKGFFSKKDKKVQKEEAEKN